MLFSKLYRRGTFGGLHDYDISRAFFLVYVFSVLLYAPIEVSISETTKISCRSHKIFAKNEKSTFETNSSNLVQDSMIEFYLNCIHSHVCMIMTDLYNRKQAAKIFSIFFSTTCIYKQ